MSDLINALASIPFVNEYLHKKPVLLNTQAKGDEIISWDKLNTLLNSDILDFPRVRVITNDLKLTRGSNSFLKYRQSSGGGKVAKVSPEMLNLLLRQGCSLLVDGIDQFIPEVKTLVRELESSFDCRSTANLYAAWRNSSSFGAHFDDHDVIALQLYGSKVWRLSKPTYQDPLPGDKSFYAPPPTGEPDETILVEQGQAVYVPAGYWHDVQTECEPSLHLSIVLEFPRRLDVLQQAIAHLAANPYFRAPLPVEAKMTDMLVLKEAAMTALRELDLSVCAHEAKLLRHPRSIVNLPEIGRN